MSNSEHDFLLKRLEIIENRLANASEYEPAGKERFRFRTQPVSMIEYNMIREARSIEKLIEQVEEGKVSKAVAAW